MIGIVLTLSEWSQVRFCVSYSEFASAVGLNLCQKIKPWLLIFSRSTVESCFDF
jgi:hypothetical protein